MVNAYGLFRVMTTTRPELTIEASADGIEWSPYVFKYKPGPLDRTPPGNSLHMPRLDWQMWFAGLSAERGQLPGWFQSFLLRLQEANKPVLDLLESVPLDGQPPQVLRVRLGSYLFTNGEQREKSGDWWRVGNDRVVIPPFGPTNLNAP